MTVTIGRRELLAALGGAACAWPLAARAQQSGDMRRVGILMPFAERDREGQTRVTAFREGLQKLGWTEGRNIRIDYRWASDATLMPQFAKELVALKPELILASSTPATASILEHTRTIPIVFVQVTDPIGAGFVASLARPGGNVTGFIAVEPTMAGKWVELLKEIAPRVTRVAAVFNPATAAFPESCASGCSAAAFRSGGWRCSCAPCIRTSWPVGSFGGRESTLKYGMLHSTYSKPRNSGVVPSSASTW